MLFRVNRKSVVWYASDLPRSLNSNSSRKLDDDPVRDRNKDLFP